MSCLSSSRMRDAEMMQRVVGVLTQAGEVTALLKEDIDRDDLRGPHLVMGELIAEVLHVQAEMHGSVTPQDVANKLMELIEPRVAQLTGCFVAAFLRLAEYHEAGRTDVSSADVLRKLALEWEAPDLDDRP